MANEQSGDPAAQCCVPNITLSQETSRESTNSPVPTTPNTPVVLLAKARDSPSSLAQPQPAAIPELAPVSLLQRPLSAPTSMVASSTAPQDSTNLDVDASIVEALKSSKDRLYVLKLGETMESLIGQGRLYAKVELQPASSYQRLLVHRCAAFYHLTQESSHSTVSVIVTQASRIPSKRLAELVPPEETVLPAFQIMRRVDRSKTASRATSVDGNLTDDGDESTRSQGSGSKKKHMTIEEREAAYHKARSRIFMDFEEKETSTSSGGAISSAASTVSYTGGSTGMSSVDGDGASTAPTESEYSAPAGRGKESWHGNNGRGTQNIGASSKALKSTAPPFTNSNVPPPPKGTVHFIPPIPDPNLHPDIKSSHPPQGPTGNNNGTPAGGYPPYPQPAIYPYYVPYFYPMPYPPPVASHPPSAQPGPPSEAPRKDHQPGQPPLQPSVPPGYAPHYPPPQVSGQPYPSYMWLPSPHPGCIPAPPAVANLPPPAPAQQQGSNIVRPASQASHASQGSFDQRAQSHTQPPPQTQQQNIPYGTYPPPPNTFPPHSSQPVQNTPTASTPMMHPNGPPVGHPPMPNPGPAPGTPSFSPPQAPMGGSQQPANASWNNQYPPLKVNGPNSGMAQRPVGRGMAPSPPGRAVGDGNRGASNMGGPNNTGGKRPAPPRHPWGAHSYGPGVGGIHTGTPPPGGGISMSGPAPVGPNNGALRAPEGLNIRILPPITLENHNTGGSHGSNSSLKKKNLVSTQAGVVKPAGDETSSVTQSSSSSSSKRTFTSTASSQPQHHPLPERPDWVLNNRSQPGGALPNRTRGPQNLPINARPSLQPASGPVSATPSPVNGSSAVASSASSVAGPDPMSKEFPPLESKSTAGSGQVSRARTPASPAGAWNTTLLRSGSASTGMASANASRPTSTGGDGRLDEPDRKFERPPPKTGASLYNPRDTVRSKSGDHSPKPALQADARNVEGVTHALDATTLASKKDDGTARSSTGSAVSGTSAEATTDGSSVDGQIGGRA